MNITTTPKVSILVACYNHETYIEACLQSILQQSYKNIELIVIDDGSRDNSYSIVRRLADQHGFYAEQQQNLGLTKTLNKMLGLATGSYICQFGSDDIMMPDKTTKQVAFMEANPDVAACGGNALNIDSAGVIVNKRQSFPPHREITFERLFAGTIAGIAASTCMIRKSVLDREGGWDPAIPLEDMYMWFKLTSRGHRLIGFNDVLMYYRKHQSNSYKNVRYMYEAMMKTISAYQSHPLYEEVHIALLRSCFLKAAKGDKALARGILRQLPISKYNMKVLRGLLYLLFTPGKPV